jgi:hypothetical protein
MSSYARLDEAFRSKDPRKKGSSNSSSESIRKEQRAQQGGRETFSYTETDFNDHFRVKDSPKVRAKSSNYLEDTAAHMTNQDYDYYEPRNRRDNVYQRNLNDYVAYDCVGLINQVLQNNTCKRILRNILLDEYLDNLIKQRFDGLTGAVRASGPINRPPENKPCYYPNKELIEGFSDYLGVNQSGGNYTLFGLDLKTLVILFLVAIVCLYMYDLVNRLFRG